MKVWGYIDCGDSHADDAQYPPTNEADDKREEFGFVSHHHPFARFDSLFRAKLRIFTHDKKGHGIAKSGYYSGDEQEEAPQEDVQRRQNSCQKCLAKIAESR